MRKASSSVGLRSYKKQADFTLRPFCLLLRVWRSMDLDKMTEYRRGGGGREPGCSGGLEEGSDFCRSTRGTLRILRVFNSWLKPSLVTSTNSATNGELRHLIWKYVMRIIRSVKIRPRLLSCWLYLPTKIPNTHCAKLCKIQKCFRVWEQNLLKLVGDLIPIRLGHGDMEKTERLRGRVGKIILWVLSLVFSLRQLDLYRAWQ